MSIPKYGTCSKTFYERTTLMATGVRRLRLRAYLVYGYGRTWSIYGYGRTWSTATDVIRFQLRQKEAGITEISAVVGAAGVALLLWWTQFNCTEMHTVRSAMTV